MTSDLELLREYSRNQSEESFAALVNRHLNLVYSAALRQVRSPQLAEEVVQSTFTDLARNAHRLAPDTILTAWLYQVTRRTAIDAVRREARRQVREQVAHELTAMNALATDWTQIEPLLEEAMHALDAPERTAVLLRYFENKSLREVSQSLGTSEAAAQKRVSRAVDRLRAFFTKRGVTVGTGGLMVILSANAVQAAPVGMAVTISTTAALAGTTLATTATVSKAIVMTTLQKVLVSATVASLIAAVTVGVYETSQVSTLHSQNQALKQQQAPAVGKIEQLQRDVDESARQLAALRADNEQLKHNSAELLKLRAEVTRLQNVARASAPGRGTKENDATEAALKKWVNKVNLLQQRFEQWPGKKTPELKLLSAQDWLKETENRQLETEADCREAMAQLRYQAKNKFSQIVNNALEEYAKANNEQLPSELSQLAPYLNPPVGSFLEGYEIAKAGTVHPPSPGGINSERAATWAMIEKGSITRDAEVHADKDYDMSIVIYRGGAYGYGPVK